MWILKNILPHIDIINSKKYRLITTCYSGRIVHLSQYKIMIYVGVTTHMR